MTFMQTLITVALFAATTLLTRALPFLLFPADRPTSKFVLYLGKVLPYAIAPMLLVYCFRELDFLAYPHALPEVLAVLSVGILFRLFHNSLISIAGGTALYMLLIQTTFA